MEVEVYGAHVSPLVVRDMNWPCIALTRSCLHPRTDLKHATVRPGLPSELRAAGGPPSGEKEAGSAYSCVRVRSAALREL